MKDRIRELMSEVFGVTLRELGKNPSPERLAVWDSLKHMELVVTLEEEFGVRFTDEEILELISIELIAMLVQEKRPPLVSRKNRKL